MRRNGTELQPHTVAWLVVGFVSSYKQRHIRSGAILWHIYINVLLLYYLTVFMVQTLGFYQIIATLHPDGVRNGDVTVGLRLVLMRPYNSDRPSIFYSPFIFVLIMREGILKFLFAIQEIGGLAP